VPKADRLHHGDEFGQPTGSSVIGADAPIIGAAYSITLDAQLEREAGKTPLPPPISIKAMGIGLLVAFLIGLAGLVWFIPFLASHLR
jgi:hypothetical protein